ncbi:ParB/RepB/Spo0J family partition protein [Dongia soli]|uniref:ParB/RepB/Spo0J family partition protein n=1 Tax=Dongia soli TaxID=600628 RepID=A0ABU5E6M5_9PROT|nr:ParB/RepB/Spo0J family partition protein [Dongia soli]MDY0881952.1 ParB/RepB/Spo0J family partition protein [Dongia soli]
MAAKKHIGLGRGLSALLGGDEVPVKTGNAPAAAEASSSAGAATAGTPSGAGNVQRHAPIEFLHPGKFQPRHVFDEELLENLAQSIRENGVLQPILVRDHPQHKGQFEIVAGERRWRAAQLAQLHQVPIVFRALGDREVLEIAIIENVQRQDLSPLEEAQGYDRLMAEFKYTQEQLAERIGKSRPHIANMLRLLDLPEPVRKLLADGKLTVGHARALIKADDPVALAQQVVDEGLNVRQTEALAQAHKPGTVDKPNGKGAPRGLQSAKPAAEKDADTKALERDLSHRLGLKVEIDFDGAAGGQVVVHYRSLEQLDDIIGKLNS